MHRPSISKITVATPGVLARRPGFQPLPKSTIDPPRRLPIGGQQFRSTAPIVFVRCTAAPLTLSNDDRLELALFQPKDIGAATVENIGQRERDACAGGFRLGPLRRRRRVG